MKVPQRTGHSNPGTRNLEVLEDTVTVSPSTSDIQKRGRLFLQNILLTLHHPEPKIQRPLQIHNNAFPIPPRQSTPSRGHCQPYRRDYGSSCHQRTLQWYRNWRLFDQWHLYLPALCASYSGTYMSGCPNDVANIKCCVIGLDPISVNPCGSISYCDWNTNSCPGNFIGGK